MIKISKNLFTPSLLLLFFCFFSSNILLAQEINIPASAQGYVSDFAGLMNLSDKGLIKKYATELEKKTTAEIAIVTVKTTKPESIENFSVRLFDKWKIGKKHKDNGVLIVVAISDRVAWISTGYGLEGAIPDLTANKIVNEVMVPFFKKNQYSTGIKQGAITTISLIAKEYNVQITGQEAATYRNIQRKKSPFEIIFTILLFIFIFSSRSGFLGYFLFGSLLGGRRRGGYWHGTGIGGSSGGFSGGFGGFGGGMTGGGGGGGGW